MVLPIAFIVLAILHGILAELAVPAAGFWLSAILVWFGALCFDLMRV